MLATVFVPITFSGNFRSIFGSFAARRCSSPAAVSIPAVMMPPSYSPVRETTSNVVAVPKSTITMGPRYFA